MSNKVRKAVGVLYAMDNFVLSVMDNMYWLSMGVPDGEFDEVDRHAAEVNFADHDWLIIDDEDKFDTEAFKELIEAFEDATDDADDYDQTERDALIKEANEILSMNESWEDEDEFETDERYFIYDENDNCVSDGFKYEEDAIKKAESADYPVVKVHRYFYDERGKMRPDGYPTAVWIAGEHLSESLDDMNRRCEECNTLLTDAGECPKCMHGEESLNEDRVTRGLDRANRKNNKAFDKKADPKYVAKVLASTYKDPTNEYFIDNKWYTHDQIQNRLDKLIRALNGSDKSLNLIAYDPKSEAVKLIDAIVRDKKGYIIRRGLELIKSGNLRYDDSWMDRMDIENGYRAEDIMAKPQDVSIDANASDENTASETSDKAQEEPNTNTPETAPDKEEPKGVSDKTIQNTINAAKVFGMKVFGLQGGQIQELNDAQLKSLGANSDMEKIWVGKDDKSRVTLSQLAAELKKRNIVEAYDDTIEYDNIHVEETDLEEGLSDDEMQELIRLGKEIGLKTLHDVEKFADREGKYTETTLDTLRRYRDDLGPDFQLKESFDISPASKASDSDDIDSNCFDWYIN